MKYLLLINCLVWMISCGPKYTASFQDHRYAYNNDQPMNTPHLLVTDSLVSPAMQPAELIATIENKPTEKTLYPRIDLLRDTVITVKQDTIILKNGDKIVGKITEVTSRKLVCRVSEWMIARSSKSKKGRKQTDRIILLKDVFLIKYANGTSETVNFSEMVGTSSSTKADPKKNSLAIIGLVLGILSLFPIYGLLLTIPAILISSLGFKSEKRALAILGFVLGIIGIILGTVWLYYLFVLGWG